MANEILKNITIDGTTFDLEYLLRTGGTITGDLIYKTNADASKANNGVSGVLYPAVPIITDSSNRVLARAEAIVNPNGEISYYPYIRNYNTSGTQVAQKGLKMTMAKDGTMKAYLESNKPASNTSDTQIATTAFVQDAINRRLTKTRTSFYSNASAVAIPNGSSGTQVDMWTAPSAGMVIAHAICSFASNATGYRGLEIKLNNAGIGAGTQIGASSSGVTTLCVPIMARVASGNKLQMKVYQGSGANLNCNYRHCYGWFIPD